MKYQTYKFRKGMSLLRPNVVEKRTGLCRSEIDRRREAGRFPPPIKLGPQSIAWPDYVIDEYIRDLSEGRLIQEKLPDRIQQSRRLDSGND